MAMKSSSYTATCLFLFLLLTSHLHLSHGAEDSPAYDIDYRGPETHPSMAPPSHFRERPWGRRRDYKEPPKVPSFKRQEPKTGGRG
ncbi:hypothetical protein MLD38_017653 [Melastoma candidum]|uniref:Uncharacterized protein n=1 Tax=Melastoma candidum TaxID=119954 RepID=A0ACB9QSF5_9MYRT|nr:hypothetical protein MLD38_017653 [Melastoma candidum]